MERSSNARIGWLLATRSRINASGITSPLRIAGIAREPVRVVEQAVAEHRLRLGVGHRRGRVFLREARRVLHHVGEVRGVAALVEQGVDGAQPAAHLVGLGLGGEVDLAGHPLALFVHPGGDGAVAEAVLVLAGTLHQIQLHRGAAVTECPGGGSSRPSGGAPRPTACTRPCAAPRRRRRRSAGSRARAPARHAWPGSSARLRALAASVRARKSSRMRLSCAGVMRSFLRSLSSK